MAKGNILQRMWAAFAKDADPEEALEAAKLVNGDGKDEKPVEPEDPNEARFKRIEDALADLSAKLNPPAEDTVPEEVEEEAGTEADVDEEGDALDALEEELTEREDVEDEDAVEADPEEINESQSAVTDGLIEAEESEDVVEDGCSARDAALETIKALRPFVATLPTAQRRKAADALAQMIRGNVRDSGYAAIQKATRRAADSRPVDDAALGREIAAKYNPHYKKEV